MKKQKQPVRSVGAWKERCKKVGSSHQIAHLILADLGGYRQTSLTRADDGDELDNVIRAVVQLTLDDPTWMKS